MLSSGELARPVLSQQPPGKQIISHRLPWGRLQDDTLTAGASTPGTMGQCWSAHAKEAQEFGDIGRATEILIGNSHQCSVAGGRRS